MVNGPLHPSPAQLKVTNDAFIGRVTALRAMLRSPWEVVPFSGETASLARRDGRKGTILLRCTAIEGGVRTE